MKQLHFLFCIPLSIFSALAFGQQQDVSALKNSLPTASGQQRVDVLNDLAGQLMTSRPDEAEDYAEEAYKLSKKLNYPEGLTSSALYLGIRSRDDKNYARAVNYTEESIRAARAAKDQYAELKGLQSLITICRVDNRTKKLTETEQEYQELKEKLDQKGETENLKQELDSTEKDLNQALRRIETARNALNLSEEEKNRLDAELLRLNQEKLELELRAVQLENEANKNARLAAERQNEILKIDARRKRQQFWLILLAVGLGAAILFTVLSLRYFKLKKMQAEEKVRTQRQLLMQEKMATLGQLTAGIAHEIKNPLNFVNNFAEGSAEIAEELKESLTGAETDKNLPLELTEELRQNAADILFHGQRADRIVNSMMEHARDGSGKPQRVDLNLLIEDNLNLAYHGYRALHAGFNLEIQKDFDPSLPPVEVAPQDLGRVVLNLFNNACYALNEKYKTAGNGYHPILKITTRKVDGKLVVRIRDNGPGIPPAIREKIFTPFFTTKPTGEGNAGLGLSICYEIVVKNLKGTLEVESEVGEYAEFVIGLPLGV